MSLTDLFEAKAAILKITGMWPVQPKDEQFFGWLKTYSSVVTFAIFCTLQVVGILTVTTSDDFLESIIDLCGFLTLFARTYSLVTNRKKFFELYAETYKLEFLCEYSEKEKSTIKICQSYRSTCVKYLVNAYPFVLLSYALLPLLSSDRVLPIKLMFKPNGLPSPWYEIVYLAELLTFAWALCYMASGDIYFVTFMVQIYKELRLVKLLLTKNEDGASRGTEITGEILKRIIKRHVVILKYGETTCQILSNTFLAQHCMLYLQICFNIFLTITTQNPVVVNKTVTSILVAGLILFSVCIVGEIVTTVSEDIADAVIQCDLELYGLHDDQSLNNLRNVSFFLLRAQKPLKLSVGTFGLMNLQFFSSTVKSIFSFLMILRTVLE